MWGAEKNEVIEYLLSRQPAPFWLLPLQAETFQVLGGRGEGKSEPRLHGDQRGTGLITSVLMRVDFIKTALGVFLGGHSYSLKYFHTFHALLSPESQL